MDEIPTSLLPKKRNGGVSTDIQQTGSKKKFPKSVFFIVSNEFCERFSYYGMRAVLTIYFVDQLNMSENNATITFHVFVMMCYFMPVFGAMIADSWLGKFRTIFYLSIVYAIGNIVLSLSATPPLSIPMLPFSMLGLFLIAVGTGGIKPCVSAFGGDQFDTDQVRQRERFFFIFYFSINAGSLISTFITPIFRADVACFQQESCFPLAFGVPALLMIVSIVLFVSGKFLYRMVPPAGNVVIKVLGCVKHALGRRCKTNETRDHWLDYADDRYDNRFIIDVRAALRVMFLYIPLPIFWALYDQQGSRWTLQATQLDGTLTSSFTVKPDQMQVINPFLILLFIPLFESGIYPLLAKCHLLKKSLHRMFVGGLLAALAFVAAGLLDMAIERNELQTPSAGHSQVAMFNTLPCNLLLVPNVGTSQDQLDINVTLHPGKTYPLALTVPADSTDFLFNLTAIPLSCDQFGEQNFVLHTASALSYTAVFLPIYNSSHFQMVQGKQTISKPNHGNADIRLAYSLSIVPANFSVIYLDGPEKYQFLVSNSSTYGMTDYQAIVPGEYTVRLPTNASDANLEGMLGLGKIKVQSGGRYTFSVVAQNASSASVKVATIEVTANTLSMMWQVPQYVIITAAEIMFSITGLEFSYSQAPSSMKSVLQAAWLITDAFGNVIVIIISNFSILNGSKTSFLYAAVMAIIMIIFAFMCLSYQYVWVDEEGNIHPITDESDAKNEKCKLRSTPEKEVHYNSAYQKHANDATSEL